jgi:DNA-binding transcriptional LysR family regulator
MHMCRAKMQAMRWDDLRFFLAVARGGSFGAAARELGVDHTTVGRRIRALQRRLGAALFHRAPSGLELTSAGESMRAACERIESATIELERQLAGRDKTPAGLVRITATETFSARFVIPALAALRRRHPELEFEVLPDYRRLDLSRQQADIALRNVRPAEAGLVCRRIAEFGFSLYASRTYLRRHPPPPEGGGLVGHDLIAWSYILPSTKDQFRGVAVDGARIALRSNSTNALLHAAINGLGIAPLPCYLGDEREELERIWPKAPPAMETLWMIYHEDLRRTARVRLVADALVQAFAKERRLLRGDTARSGG